MADRTLRGARRDCGNPVSDLVDSPLDRARSTLAMIPVAFPESNAVLARDQGEYEPLAVYIFPNHDLTGRIACCFRLSDAEIAEIVRTRTLWVQQLTFGRRFQPIGLSVSRPTDIPCEEYEGGDDPKADPVTPPPPLPPPPDALALGDRLAHELLHAQYPELLDAWWKVRGGHDACTVCRPP
jgi:hypothetical protein